MSLFTKTPRTTRIAVTVILVVLSISVISIVSLRSNAVYFYTPEEAFAQKNLLSGRQIRIGGVVERGSVVKRQDHVVGISFMISGVGDTTTLVKYNGAVPDMFREEAGVVCEGVLSPRGTEFVASSLFVKHDESYSPPHKGKEIDPSLIKKSMFKDEIIDTQ